MQSREDNDSCQAKYAVPSFYDIYRSGGTTLKDNKRGMRLMLHYFSEYFTEEQLQENMQRYNLENMLAVIKDYFLKEYGYVGDRIELNNRYQRTVNSYIYNDEEDPAVVHIDELLESTMMAFFLAMFKWSKNFDDLEVYGNCYVYVLFLMNEAGILGEMQGEDANSSMLGMIADDLQILQLAEDCYWTALAFSLAHEVAHAYLASIGKKYTKEHPEKEEFDADEIAYHIVLRIIIDKGARGIVLEPYTYLAPMMYMDYFDMVYYTDRILYKTIFYNASHPTLKKRKGWLFAIVDRDEYDFDTREGNILYRGFNEVYKEYKSQTIMKMQKGKLDKIIHTEQRERLKELTRTREKEEHEQTAMEYDESLSRELQNFADNCGENRETAKNIVDHFIEFIPDDDIKGMVFLDDDPVSYKLGNVRLDLRKAIGAGLELAASVSRPESIFNYVQLLIVSALFIRNAARQELTGIEAYVVYLLHRKGAYQSGIDEEQFILDLQEWYMQKKGITLERGEIVETINHLYKMKVADFINGKICLKEKVWGKLE